MHLRQKTLLKSCRDATLGRDNTLAPNATPLPRISPALTQNESIDYDDSLDYLGKVRAWIDEKLMLDALTSTVLQLTF